MEDFMSDDVKKPETGSTDSLENMKAEFNRKLSNMEQANQVLRNQLSTMLKAAAPAAAPKTENLEDVWFDKPEVAAAKIEQRVLEKVNAAAQSTQRTNSTIAKLTQDFPELMDDQSDLTKKAVEIYSSFTDDEKSSPVAYRAAVKEAALELGVKPKSQRREEQEEDDFSFSGSGAGRARTEGRASRRDTVDPRTIEFAKMVGLDVSDPKVKENLKSHQKRSWRNYGK